MADVSRQLRDSVMTSSTSIKLDIQTKKNAVRASLSDIAKQRRFL